MVGRKLASEDPVLCSNCFENEGLILEATQLGVLDNRPCANCESTAGYKLSRSQLSSLAHLYFVLGTTIRPDYGAAPIIVFNEHQRTGERLRSCFGKDVDLISEKLGVGFFNYGPRMWMLGDITPLQDLIDPDTRDYQIEQILRGYPDRQLGSEQKIYRVRINPSDANEHGQYDSPPAEFLGRGRLDSPEQPILYASSDLEVCLHECRVGAEDEMYFATLRPTRPLRLLDLSVVIEEPGTTEFESLDHAVYFLFMAGRHSYNICRDIAAAALSKGYDGIVYPSYFSRLRTGVEPFDTIYGLSSRLVANFENLAAEKREALRAAENARTVPNLALFGRPILEGKLGVECINQVYIQRAQYHLRFGPAPNYF